MTDPVHTPISGELMFQIRQAALNGALQIASIGNEPAVAKVAYDASVLLHFLISGMPVETAPGYITAPQPNTPEVLAGAGGVAPAQEAAPVAPKAKKAKLSAVPTSASAANSQSAAPVQAAFQAPIGQPAPGSNTTASNASTPSTPTVVPAPTTLQAASNSLKALVQDEARGGRKAAVDLLAAFGVSQLNQIPAAKLAEFKQALDTAGLAVTAPASAGSDLL